MGSIGAPELLIVLVVLLVFFGAKKLPQLARSMGQAGKEFKSGLKEGYVAQPVEGPCPFCEAEIPPDSKFCPGCARSADQIVAEKERLDSKSKAS